MLTHNVVTAEISGAKVTFMLRFSKPSPFCQPGGYQEVGTIRGAENGGRRAFDNSNDIDQKPQPGRGQPFHTLLRSLEAQSK